MWMQQGNGGAERKKGSLGKELTTCIKEVVIRGYTESFIVTTRGLYAISKGRYYRPEQVKIVSHYHFKAKTHKDENTELYVVETTDGLRGILIDACPEGHDDFAGKFFRAAEDICKKIERYNQHRC